MIIPVLFDIKGGDGDCEVSISTLPLLPPLPRLSGTKGDTVAAGGCGETKPDSGGEEEEEEESVLDPDTSEDEVPSS